MTDLKKNYIKLKILFYFYFSIGFFLVSLFSPVIISAFPSKVIIGPLSILGEISTSEKQILFNHFREQINKRYHLVSHKILELISEQGLISFDIENCNSSKCVRIILNFLKNLSDKYDAKDLFLLQLVRNKSETHFSLKLASLSMPEVTKNIINKSCHKCDIENLKITIDVIVNNMFKKLGFEDFETREIEKSLETKIDTKKKAPLKKFFENEKKHQEYDLTPTLEKTSPSKAVKKNELDDKIIKTKSNSDPYKVDRDLYNQHIGRLLTDVTYALQIFRSGMFVQIEVSIDPSGSVVNQKIINSSGSNDFDETAMLTLNGIQFKPLPKTMLKYGNYVVILQIHNSR